MSEEDEIVRRSKYWRLNVGSAIEIGDVRITVTESRRGRACLRIQAPESMRFKAIALPPVPAIASTTPPIEAPTPLARAPLSSMDFGEWRRLTREARGAA